MTDGQVANGVGSFFAMVTSGTFIVVWTIVGKWWKTQVGRFMVMKASAIFMAGLLTVMLTVTEFESDADWLRYTQAVIWVAVSVVFVAHTRLLWKVNREDEK